MSEQPGGSHPEETGATDYAGLYKAEHPNAVEDKKKAEVMARAGDAEETKVAQHRTAAYEVAGKIGDLGRDIGDDVHENSDHIDAADDARELADLKESEAGRVYDEMKETGATGSVALYKEAHPDAVEDKKKAELMARAGDAAETAVVRHRSAALEVAGKAGDPDRNQSDEVREIADHIEAAEEARELADQKEGVVGITYDKVKDL
jgi:hypothetical protein